METTVTLPKLGEGIDTGTVAKVVVADGEPVTAGALAVEIEAGKAIVPVPSPVSGRVKKVLVKSGQEIDVGADLFTVETAEAEKSPPAPPPPPKKEAPAAEASKTEPAVKQALPAPEEAETETEAEDTLPAGPAARKLARELGVDLQRVRGSQKGGRIDQEDVKAYVRALTRFVNDRLGEATAAGPSEPAPAGPRRPNEPSSPALVEILAREGPIETQPMSAIRKATALAMTQSWTSIPHVFEFHEIDVTSLMTVLRDLKEKGIRLTMTAVLLKAVAEMMREMPQFNAALDMESRTIIYRKFVHIGVAVDTEAGLLVPVIRDVDQKELTALAGELDALGRKARERALSPEELSGGGFAISNLGGLGAGHFTPLITPRQVAVLGVGRARPQSLYRNEAWQMREILPVSLSYDHRLIDGADAARFLTRLTAILEEMVCLPFIPVPQS